MHASIEYHWSFQYTLLQSYSIMLSIGDNFLTLDEARKTIQSLNCITKLQNLENNEECNPPHLAKQQGRPRKR